MYWYSFSISRQSESLMSDSDCHLYDCLDSWNASICIIHSVSDSALCIQMNLTKGRSLGLSRVLLSDLCFQSDYVCCWVTSNPGLSNKIVGCKKGWINGMAVGFGALDCWVTRGVFVSRDESSNPFRCFVSRLGLSHFNIFRLADRIDAFLSLVETVSFFELHSQFTQWREKLSKTHT